MNEDLNLKGMELDRELNSDSQMRVREIVRALPEETLSLSWRSELNGKLREQVARKKRLDLAGWLWKPAAGVALAGALAIAFVARMPMHGPTAAHDGVENALVNSYLDSTAAWEVAGDNAGLGDAKDAAGKAAPVSNDWEQEDVGATL